MSEDYTTYDDDKCLGIVAPSLELLEFVRGEKIDYVGGKVHVVYFWAKYYKGGLPVTEEISALLQKHSDVVFIAISADAEKSEVEKFLSKEHKNEKTGAPIQLSAPYICFDDKSVTRKLFSEAMGGKAVSIPQAFIIGKDGKIAWRQVFSQSLIVSQTDFEKQLIHVLEGTSLEAHGKRPQVEAGPAEEAECDDLSLF